MYEQTYIVLQLSRSGSEDGAQFGPAAAAGPPTAELRTQALSKTEAIQARQAPDVVIAPPMPIGLVKPVEANGPDPEQPEPGWGVSATGAMDSPFSGAGVKVAVLDTGIDETHEAFEGVTVQQEDFTGEGPGDANGHGTHCAGIILGRRQQGPRYSVAPGVTDLFAGKVLNARGGGSTETIAKGLQWALELEADVISMSIGVDFPGYVEELIEKQGVPRQPATSQALKGYRDNLRLFEALANLAAANAAFGHGSVLFAAAGNESQRDADMPYTIDVSPPAASLGFVSVGAIGQGTQDDLVLAPFSNTSPAVVAPGVGILSAKAGGGFIVMSGTSMATPCAAGIAALWAESMFQRTGRIDPAGLENLVLGRARPVQQLQPIDVGAGLVTAPSA